MRWTHRAALAAVFCAAGSVAALAHADVKVVQQTDIDNPRLKAMIQSLNPQQRQVMAAMGMGSSMETVVYVSGGNARIDVGKAMTVLSNAGDGKATMINRLSHTYQSYSLSDLEKSAAAAGSSGSMKPTGRTKSILGHICHEYKGVGSAQGASGTVDVWVAPDLPRMPTAAAMDKSVMSFVSRLNGFPLAATVVSNGPGGTTSYSTHAVSISTSSLPSALFVIPGGYTQSQGPMMSPGAGGAPAGVPGQ